MLKQKAFTLAEVLLTLGVIGIIAALTLPSIISKHQESQTVARVNKTYTVLANALQLLVFENGDIDTWNFPCRTTNCGSSQENLLIFSDMILPYLKVAKNCELKPNCMLVVDYKFLDGSKWTGYDNNTRDKRYYKIILNDGSYIMIRFHSAMCAQADSGYSDTCGWFLLDVNGQKAPNIFGKDVFLFLILKNSLMPSRVEDFAKDASPRKGTGASSYIIQNGNMNYLH